MSPILTGNSRRTSTQFKPSHREVFHFSRSIPNKKLKLAHNFSSTSSRQPDASTPSSNTNTRSAVPKMSPTRTIRGPFTKDPTKGHPSITSLHLVISPTPLDTTAFERGHIPRTFLVHYRNGTREPCGIIPLPGLYCYKSLNFSRLTPRVMRHLWSRYFHITRLELNLHPEVPLDDLVSLLTDWAEQLVSLSVFYEQTELRVEPDAEQVRSFFRFVTFLNYNLPNLKRLVLENLPFKLPSSLIPDDYHPHEEDSIFTKFPIIDLPVFAQLDELYLYTKEVTKALIGSLRKYGTQSLKRIGLKTGDLGDGVDEFERLLRLEKLGLSRKCDYLEIAFLPEARPMGRHFVKAFTELRVLSIGKIGHVSLFHYLSCLSRLPKLEFLKFKILEEVTREVDGRVHYNVFNFHSVKMVHLELFESYCYVAWEFMFPSIGQAFLRGLKYDVHGEEVGHGDLEEVLEELAGRFYVTCKMIHDMPIPEFEELIHSEEEELWDGGDIMLEEDIFETQMIEGAEMDGEPDVEVLEPLTVNSPRKEVVFIHL